MARRRNSKEPAERPGPRGGKRARNREERVASLAQAGTALFLEHGIEAVSIDELARAAGMAKGNFYRYFADKGELVDAILAPLAGDARRVMRKAAISIGRAETRADLDAAYAALAMGLAASSASNFEVLQLYLQENRAPLSPSRAGVHALRAELTEGAVHLTRVAVEHGLLRVADPHVSARAVVGAVEELALARLREELEVPAAEIARIIVGMVLEGIATSAKGAF